MAIRLPDLDDDEQRTLGMLVAQLEAKQLRNALRTTYYDAKRRINQVSTIIPPQYYNLGIVLGWSAKAVDVLARRCNLDSFVWPDGDLESIGYATGWEGNQLGTEVSSAMISSLEMGTSFLINTLGDPEAGEPVGMISAKDALNATGTWNARAKRLDNLLSVTSRGANGQITSLALYLNGVTVIGWLEADGFTWGSDRAEHAWGVPAEPLVYKPRTRRPFGSSRITRPVMALQDAAIRTVIRMEGHADVYSFPEMWMLGADESIFKNSDGTMKAAWEIRLGRLKGIPDDEDATVPRADVKQFPASSPEPHLAQLNALAKMFAREVSLPDSSVAITDVANPTSAESYDASQYELIAEAEGATDDWAPALKRAEIRALAMQNGVKEIPPEWKSIAPKFRDPRFLSRAAEADAGMKQLTAVPWLADTDVGLELLGLNEQQMSRALSAKRRMSGSAALRAITQAAAGVTDDQATEAAPTVDAQAVDAAGMKAKFDALGAAIRSGVEPKSAARLLGLDGLEFTGAVPVSLRVPESDAAALEGP